MIKNTIRLFLLCIFVFAIGGYTGFRFHVLSSIPIADTITIRDTVKIHIPQVVYRKEIGSSLTSIPKTAWIYPTGDINVPDSIDIELPIERVEYCDSNYRAVVEGYKPRLVDIEVYPSHTTIIQSARQQQGGWNLSIGPTVCWGITRDGFRLCLGLGATATYHF